MSASTLSRRGSATVPALFGLIVLQMVLFPVLTYYWTQDNNGPALSPDGDYRVRWISDADFRGLTVEPTPSYAAADGRTTYVAGKTWETLGPYYTSTPDGRWHLMVLSKGSMTPAVLRVALGLALPAVILSLIGIAFWFNGRSGGKDPKRFTRLAEV